MEAAPDSMQNWSRALEEEGRLFVYAYNASTLVTGFGLLMGSMTLMSAFSILLYYYVRGATTARRRSYDGADDEVHESQWQHVVEQVQVLDALERAFVTLGISKDEGGGEERGGCRPRLVCEAYLPHALTINRAATSLIAGAISQLTPAVMSQLKGAALVNSNDLLAAANRGRHGQDCSHYHPHCPHRTLEDMARTWQQ